MRSSLLPNAHCLMAPTLLIEELNPSSRFFSRDLNVFEGDASVP